MNKLSLRRKIDTRKKVHLMLIRDVKTPKFFGPARSSFFRPGPPRNKIFYFRPVWASENILSSIFYNKTTNYLVLTDLQRRRLDFGSREEHIVKNYSIETLKNLIYKLAGTIFKIFKIILNKIINFFKIFEKIFKQIGKNN